MDDGDILCHPILVATYLQEFDVANAKVGAERNPQTTEVIYHMNDQDATPLEGRIRDVQNMDKIPLEASRSESLPDHDSLQRTSSWSKQMSFGPCTIEFSCVRSHRQSFARALASAAQATSCECMAPTILQEQRAAEIHDEVGQRCLERLFPGFTEDSVVQAALSADQSGASRDSEDMDFSAPQAQLSRLTGSPQLGLSDRTRLRRLKNIFLF